MYEELSDEELRNKASKGKLISELVLTEAWGLIEEIFKRRAKAAHFRLLEIDPNNTAEVARLQVKALLYGEINSSMATLIQEGKFSEEVILDSGGSLATVPTPDE